MFILISLLVSWLLFKIRNDFLRVNYILNFTTKWLARNWFLQFLTIFLILGIKLLGLVLGVKLTNILQTGYQYVDGARRKIHLNWQNSSLLSTLLQFFYWFLDPFFWYIPRFQTVLWILAVGLTSVPLFSFMYFLYIYLVKISTANFYYKQKDPIK